MKLILSTIRLSLLCTLCLTTGVLAVAQESSNNIPAALTKPIAADFDTISLTEALGELSKRAKTPIVLDTLGLEEAWIDLTSASVSYRSSGKNVTTVLDEILSPHQLVWLQRHDALIVTTPAAAAERFADTRLYKLTRKVAPARRVEAIRTGVSPESWKLAGGSGEIAPLPPSLILISQSPIVHRQIATAFAQSLAAVENPKPETYGSPALNLAMQASTQLLSKEEPLSDTLNRLAKKHRFTIEIDEAAMKAAEIDLGELKVSFKIEEQIRLASLLSLALELSHRELLWLPRGDKILVTTKAAAMKSTASKTYDLKEVIAKVDAKYLTEAIEYNISPASWEFGGGDGKLELSDHGKLAVTQSELVHRELARFLESLRYAVQEK